ncbi:hypothetical protein RFI_11328, partial [Reticulomyxa filosa]
MDDDLHTSSENEQSPAAGFQKQEEEDSQDELDEDTGYDSAVEMQRQLNELGKKNGMTTYKQYKKNVCLQKKKKKICIYKKMLFVLFGLIRGTTPRGSLMHDATTGGYVVASSNGAGETAMLAQQDRMSSTKSLPTGATTSAGKLDLSKADSNPHTVGAAGSAVPDASTVASSSSGTVITATAEVAGNVGGANTTVAVSQPQMDVPLQMQLQTQTQMQSQSQSQLPPTVVTSNGVANGNGYSHGNVNEEAQGTSASSVTTSKGLNPTRTSVINVNMSSPLMNFDPTVFTVQQLMSQLEILENNDTKSDRKDLWTQIKSMVESEMAASSNTSNKKDSLAHPTTSLDEQDIKVETKTNEKTVNPKNNEELLQ